MDNTLREERIKELIEEITVFLDNYAGSKEKEEFTDEYEDGEMLYIPSRNLNKQDINETSLENNEEIITCENPSDSIMFSDYKIFSQMRSKIISLVGYGKAIKYESIIQYFNPDEIIRPVIDEIIDNLIHEELMESKFGYLFAGEGTLKEYLASNFDREQVICAWLRLNGFRLDEISEALGMQFEEVRTREALTFRQMKHPKRINQWKKLKEMSFSRILNMYGYNGNKLTHVDNEVFSEIYGLPLTYKLLSEVNVRDYDENHFYLDLNEYLQDDAFTEELRQRYLDVFGKRIIYLDGKYQKINRQILIKQFFATNYTLKSVSIEEFEAAYNNMLKNKNLSDSSLELPYSINALLDNQKYLIKGYKEYRYYNFENYNAKDLVKKLNFSSIKNLYLSSKYFFDRYPEVMEEFNLLDPYELHNYLSKTSNEWNNSRTRNITICRMPHLEFGIVNREEQIEKLLLKNLSISKADFCLLCEKEYGIQANTANAEFHEIIRKYLDGEMLVKDANKLSKQKIRYLKDYLLCVSKAAFTKEAFKELIDSIGDYDIEITNFICSNLGFRLYEGFVLKNTYTTVKEYLVSLENNGVLNLQDQRYFDFSLLKTRSFASAINDLKKDGFITEVEKGYYYVVDNVEWQKLRKELSSDATYISELNREDKEVFKKLILRCNAYVKRHGKVNESVIFDWTIDFNASFEAESAFYKWVEAKGIEIEKLPRKEKNKTVITPKNITPLNIKECKDIEEFKEECLRIINSGGLLGEADVVDGLEKYKLSDDETEAFTDWLVEQGIELEQDDDLDLDDYDIYELGDYDDYNEE